MNMDLSEFVKIQDVKRFVDAVFGEKAPFSVESSESIEKNISRRVEDRSVLKSYIAAKSSDMTFWISISEKDGEDVSRYLPEIFGKPDYSKLLRDKFREINKVDVELWNIEFNFIRSIESESIIHEIKIKFTVRYA
jgi:hypothetical protein